MLTNQFSLKAHSRLTILTIPENLRRLRKTPWNFIFVIILVKNHKPNIFGKFSESCGRFWVTLELKIAYFSLSPVLAQFRSHLTLADRLFRNDVRLLTSIPVRCGFVATKEGQAPNSGVLRRPSRAEQGQIHYRRSREG